MKLPLLAILTFLPCVALAQSTADSDSTSDSGSTSSTDKCSDSGHKHWHHHSPAQQLAWLTTKLSLSDTQQGQIGPVLTSRDTQLKTIFENQSLSKEQKHAQAKSVFESTNQQIESFLDGDQVTEFEALHHHHHHHGADADSSSDSSNQ
jgi:hypothetical protein